MQLKISTADMNYILLFVALNQTPAQLGVYASEADCWQAVRKIYQTQFTPRGVELTADLQQSIQVLVDGKIKYQREYQCVDQKIAKL